MLVATLRNSVIVIMLASGNACVAEIAKLPAQTASNPCISTSFADMASKAPPTLTIEFDSIFRRKILAFDMSVSLITCFIIKGIEIIYIKDVYNKTTIYNNFWTKLS
jgi:hypothetical protein